MTTKTAKTRKAKFPGTVNALSQVKVTVGGEHEGTVGLYSHASGVEISPRQTVKEAYITLCHELIHYALDRSGVTAQLWQLSDRNDTIAAAIEEAIVIAVDNFLLATQVLKFNPDAGSDWTMINFKDEAKDSD